MPIVFFGNAMGENVETKPEKIGDKAKHKLFQVDRNKLF